MIIGAIGAWIFVDGYECLVKCMKLKQEEHVAKTDGVCKSDYSRRRGSTPT